MSAIMWDLPTLRCMREDPAGPNLLCCLFRRRLAAAFAKARVFVFDGNTPKLELPRLPLRTGQSSNPNSSRTMWQVRLRALETRCYSIHTSSHVPAAASATCLGRIWRVREEKKSELFCSGQTPNHTIPKIPLVNPLPQTCDFHSKNPEENDGGVGAMVLGRAMGSQLRQLMAGHLRGKTKASVPLSRR